MKAAIFDMDGVLIDSEPLWVRAEMEVYKLSNVPVRPEILAETMGFRVDEAVKHWLLKFSKDISMQDKIVSAVVDKVVELVKNEGQRLIY